jgi:uncharacterized membrane protein
MHLMPAEPLAKTEESRATATDFEPLSGLARYALVLLVPLALAGAGVAIYLLWLWVVHRGLPAGCGQGSGCAEVLNSRWSQVAGFPVSGLALVVYLGILIAADGLIRAKTASRYRTASNWSVFFATILAGAAIWFVGLQFLVIKALCPWCLGEHGLGLLVAIIVFASVRKFAIAAPLLGVVAVVLLASAQSLIEYRPPAVQRIGAGKNFDTGPGPDRWLSVLDGQLSVSPHELPVLGSGDAPNLVVVLFDYCCPHCRATHGYLLNALASHKDELGIVLLPTPLNTKCNPYWEETEPRFEHACELARLALGVWRVDRTAFVQFDAWLFEPETPREPAEARRQAEKLVPAAALEAALKDPWIDRQIERNVAAYHNSKAARIPVILSPGMNAIVGEPASGEELLHLLEKELPLGPPQASTHR